MSDRTSKDLPILASALREQRRIVAGGNVTLVWHDDEHQQHFLTGAIVDVSDRGYGLKTSEPMREGQVALLAEGSGAGRRMIVRHCDQTEDGWMIGVYSIDRERRRVDRFPARGPARLECTSEGDRFQATVEVIDISDAGARVESPIDVPIGAFARLVGSAFECVGRINNSSPVGGGFRIGIQFVGEPFKHSRPY
jgi:hypothetical protein